MILSCRIDLFAGDSESSWQGPGSTELQDWNVMFVVEFLNMNVGVWQCARFFGLSSAYITYGRRNHNDRAQFCFLTAWFGDVWKVILSLHQVFFGSGIPPGLEQVQDDGWGIRCTRQRLSRKPGCRQCPNHLVWLHCILERYLSSSGCLVWYSCRSFVEAMSILWPTAQPVCCVQHGLSSESWCCVPECLDQIRQPLYLLCSRNERSSSGCHASWRDLPWSRLRSLSSGWWLDEESG